MPQSTISDLIIEFRSATAGWRLLARFDHMAELTGRLADDAMNATRPLRGVPRLPPGFGGQRTSPPAREKKSRIETIRLS